MQNCEEADQFQSKHDVDQVLLSLYRGGDIFETIFTYNTPFSPSHWLNVGWRNEREMASEGRHEKVYLSIFTKKDNEDYYFVRNKCLINGNEISKYIYDTEWSGKLLFAQIENLDEADYRVDNFHTDFCINYFADEE